MQIANNTNLRGYYKQDHMLGQLQEKAKQREKYNGFSWILEGKLGGMREPPSLETLSLIVQNFHIGLVVSLTEQPIQFDVPSELVKVMHSPIIGICCWCWCGVGVGWLFVCSLIYLCTDFQVPTSAQVEGIVSSIHEAIALGISLNKHNTNTAL